MVQSMDSPFYLFILRLMRQDLNSLVSNIAFISFIAYP